MCLDSAIRRLMPLTASFLLMAGCARHTPQPQLAARHCAVGSYPIEAMYRGEVVQVCGVIDPLCAKTKTSCPIVDVIPVGQPNTYLDPDDDDEAQDKGRPKHPWWKFWVRGDRDKDDADQRIRTGLRQ
jgi:hypothetical protein